MKKWLFSLVKLLFSAGLLWYLLSTTEFTDIYASLKSVKLGWLVLAFISLVIGKLLTGYRWQRLLAAHQIRIPLSVLMISLYVGQFFNNFLPSTVGGDAVRAYDTAAYSKDAAKSVTTVLVDRIIGVLALVTLGLLAVIVGSIAGANVSAFVLPVIGIFVAAVLAVGMIFNKTFVTTFNRWAERFGLMKVGSKIHKAYQAFETLSDKKGVLAEAFLISTLLQVNVFLFYFIIAQSLDLGISLFYFFVIIPIALIIELIPISINGIGLREGAYVFLLSQLGVPHQEAIALAWLAFGMILTQGLIGGIIFTLKGINFERLRLHRVPFLATGLLFCLSIVGLPFLYTIERRSFQEVVIPADGYEVTGYLSVGNSNDGPWIVFGHGNRQEGENHRLYQRILNNLSDKATILAIDFSGFGQSSDAGLINSDNVFDRSGDIEAAIAYLKQTQNARDDQIILMGHSLGAVQVLNAAKKHTYRLVVPIGLGDYDTVIADETSLSNYVNKMEQNTGTSLDVDLIRQEMVRFTPEYLFTPCPSTPIALVFGSREHREALLYTGDKIPEACRATIQWVMVPFSDHMYGTEGSNMPKVLQPLYSTGSIGLLKWRLNSLIVG